MSAAPAKVTRTRPASKRAPGGQTIDTTAYKDNWDRVNGPRCVPLVSASTQQPEQKVLSMSRFLIASLIGLSALTASAAAEAHVNFDIGIGVPAYVAAPPPAPVYYEPAPVYVAPRPVVVAPRPVVVAPGYYDGWREQRWREREWRREQRWREHEWRRDRRWRDDD